MKIIFPLFFALLSLGVGGCARSTIEKGTFRATSTRWFWSTEGFSATYDPKTGIYRVSLGHTGQDLEKLIQLLRAAK